MTGPTAGGVTGLTGVVTASVPVTPIDLRSSITSRAAGSMYRIGRNLERSHALIRLGRAVGLPNDTRHDLRDLDDTWWATVDRLVNTVAGDASSSSPVRPPATTSALVAAALTDRGRARSLATSLHCLLENAASVRELFSADSWRLLSWIDQLKASLADSTTEDAIEVGTSAVTPLLALAGLVNDSMVRDPGWRFLDIGRRIEGASLVATMLGATLVDGVPRDVDGPFLEVVLDTWDGLGAYRRRYTGDIDPALVVDLLVTDESNPRSVRSHLAALAGDVGALPGPADRHAAVIASASALGALVASANPTVLAETDESGHRPRLGTLTSSVVSALDELATQIDLGYFVQVSSRLFSEVRAPAGVVANGAS